MTTTPPVGSFFGPGRILVAGATGYVGSRLIPELLACGWSVRALARRPAKLLARPFASDRRFSVVRGDLDDPESLRRALEGIGTAYYLVHSLADGSRFAELDDERARVFAAACRDAGVQRIVYLGGLGQRDSNLSPHLLSRQHTGDALRSAGVPVTELRAGIIVGSGSASFEIIRDLARKLPVMLTPRWVKSCVEPIAIRNVLHYLVGVLEEPRTTGETFDIGSGEVLTYGDLLRGCAVELGTKVRLIAVPVLTPRLSSYWLHLVTSVDVALARPLVEGLRNDAVCEDNRIRELLPLQPLSYREAVRLAIDRGRAGDAPESRWTDAQRLPRGGRASLEPPASRPARGPAFHDARTFATPHPPDEAFSRICAIGGRRGYGAAPDLLWRLRGGLDRAVGGVGLRRGRPLGRELRPGDAVDFWRVDFLSGNARRLALVAEMRVPGEARLDFAVEPDGNGGSLVHQVATLSHESALSAVYWRVLAPFHDWVFDQMGRHLLADPGAEAFPRTVPDVGDVRAVR